MCLVKYNNLSSNTYFNEYLQSITAKTYIILASNVIFLLKLVFWIFRKLADLKILFSI